MSDIERWLLKLNLAKYAPQFQEAEIEFSDLSTLTDADLKEVGLPVGPRRRVREAIIRLTPGDTSAPICAPTDSSTRPSPTPASRSATSQAERRHLTVMFVDLVGSTELASQLDPEDMRDVIRQYQNTVAGVVARYEGFVARFMGDGVLCYFGWPQANEDNAERSVRAGLEIIASIAQSRAPGRDALSVRIGIASGVVVVGDLIGKGASEEAAAIGETPNLAARMQSIAEPDQLVLPEETRSLLGNIFELTSLGAISLRGISHPVVAYTVSGESARESRFAARHTGILTPIFGREQELGLMRECWQKTRTATGQMIVINGEAGIGKSRIVQAMIDEIATDDHARITCQCSPYHTDSAFHPVITQMRFVAGFQSTDVTSTRLNKLESLPGVDQHNAALLASMLDIDASEHYDALDLTPAQQRAQTMQALCQMIIQQAHDKPLLFVFEDLHWIDPTSLELLDILLDAIADKKVLILATARSTFEHGFGGHPVVTRFVLNRLGHAQIRSIVERLTGGRSLPDEVLQIITSRTDGVPLFVEELTKTVLETGVLKEVGDHLVLEGPLDALAIPGTLHDSLMARLDRLQPIKTVAQTASCIGREFDHQLLANIARLPDDELHTALDGLIKAELVYRRGVAPDATYLFKHALVRDAAYESLLRESRRRIHALILHYLEQEAGPVPEVLAWHAEAAGMTDRAIDLWETASKAAIARPAYDEAIAHFNHAITLVTRQMNTDKQEDDAQAGAERALNLQVQLGTALLARKGYGADETKAAFEKARDLADRVGNTPMRFPVLYGLWVGTYVRAEHIDASKQADALLNLAEQSGESTPLLVANRLKGMSLLLQGHFENAQQTLEHSLSLYDPAVHDGLANRFGQELRVTAHCCIALNLWLLGHTSRTSTHAIQAEQDAIASGHINTICFMHSHLLLIALLASDDIEMERRASAIIPIASEHNLVMWQNYASAARALLLAGQGDHSGITQFMAADARLKDTKTQVYMTRFRIEAGHRALALGLIDQSTELAGMASRLIRQTGETFALSDLHRLEAALASRNGDTQTAEVELNTAIAVARDQGSLSWELRAVIDLARLWHAAGRIDEARQLLIPLYNRVPSGDCIQDYTQATLFVNELTAD